MALVQILVTAKYANVTVGNVIFQQQDWRASPEDEVIYPPANIDVRVDGAGALTASLRGSDVDIDPPWSYLVTETLQGVNGELIKRPPYLIVLPTAAAGSSVDLSTLQPDGTWDAGAIEAPGFGGGGDTGGF